MLVNCTCGPSISALLLMQNLKVDSPDDPLPLLGAGIEIFCKQKYTFMKTVIV